MVCPERDIDIERHLEAINQDENTLERERKLNEFYEELADCEEAAQYDDDEQGAARTE